MAETSEDVVRMIQLIPGAVQILQGNLTDNNICGLKTIVNTLELSEEVVNSDFVCVAGDTLMQAVEFATEILSARDILLDEQRQSTLR